jgi:tetratricopeptide (TPR) repeat protein
VGDLIRLAQELSNLGWVLQELGEYQRATELFSESLAFAQQLEWSRGIAISLSNLGLMALYGGDYALARDLFIDSMAAFNDLGDRRGLAEALEGLAGVAGLESRPEAAARLFGLAEALRERIGAPLLPTDHSRYESMMAAAREQLDAAGWQRAWLAGRQARVEDELATLLG